MAKYNIGGYTFYRLGVSYAPNSIVDLPDDDAPDSAPSINWTPLDKEGEAAIAKLKAANAVRAVAAKAADPVFVAAVNAAVAQALAQKTKAPDAPVAEKSQPQQSKR